MDESLIELRTLGRVELTDADGSEVDEVLHQPKRLALLVYLAVESDRGFHSRDTLLATFWPDLSEKRARNALNKSVHYLRTHLGSEVVVSHGSTGLGLDSRRAWCDAPAFEEAVSAGRFEAAESLWRGPFLEGFHVPDADEVAFWLDRHRERLDRLRSKALGSLGRAAAEAGDPGSASRWWRRLVDQDPFDSGAVLGLMEALEALGNRGEALRIADDHALKLREELGAEADPEVETFAGRLRVSPRPRPAIDPGPRPDLPRPPTSLVGRVEELGRIAEHLSGPGVRLVTLVGPGGVGKTRVALEAARRAVGAFPGGVFFVPLGPTRDPDRVGTAIAAAMGLESSGGRPVEEHLIETLARRGCLLVLDGFEGVLPAADLLADLLRGTDGPKAIVTSRNVLRLQGEHVLSIPPLEAPRDPGRLTRAETGSYDAVDLFVQRAVAARPDFALTDENHVAVGEVCAHLDGLPLAIELAAARTRLLSASMIRDRLSNRFDLLTGGARDLPERHQKLRATFDWSYDLLGERERRLFRRLSVFSGGVGMEAVREVCDPESGEESVFEDLAGLLDASLVTRVESGGAEPRFDLLESIREYGVERLEEQDEADEVRRRHAARFLDLAKRAEPHLTGPRQEEWFQRLTREHHNIQAALDWALARGEVELAVRLGSALWYFWWVRGHFTEMRRRVERALEGRDALSPSLRANLLVASGALASIDGDQPVALDRFQRAFKGEPGEVGRGVVVRALRSMAFTLSQTGEYERAIALLEEAHQLARDLESPADVSAALRGLAKMRFHQRRYDDAEGLYAEALEIDRAREDRMSMAWSLAGLGELARHRADMDRAARLLEEGLGLCREIGSKPGIAYLLLASGHVARYLGDFDEAEARYREALPLLRDLGNRRRIGVCLLGLAAVAVRKDDLERAVILFGAVEPIRETSRIEIAPVDEEELRTAERRVRESLTADRIDTLMRRGRGMDLEQAITAGLRTAG